MRIDRKAGTILYSKGPARRASACLPLADCAVTRVNDLEFRVSSPYLGPKGLLLASDSPEQCTRWVRCIGAVASFYRDEAQPPAVPPEFQLGLALSADLGAPVRVGAVSPVSVV